MRVAIVGPGRMGTAVAVALARAGHRIQAAAGGSPESRERFGRHLAGTRLTTDPATAVTDAELICISTPDDMIDRVVTALAVGDALAEGQKVVHFSGVKGLAALERAALAGCRTAACHPAQTVPAGEVGTDTFVGTAWAVTARVGDRPWAHELVGDLGGDPHDLSEADRVLYHAGLVLGSNAAGAAVSAARRLLLSARIADPVAFLKPLVEASVGNAMVSGAAALTGPIVRGDVGTVRSHLAALDADAADLADLYRDLSRAILAQVRPGLDESAAAEFDVMLTDRLDR